MTYSLIWFALGVLQIVDVFTTVRFRMRGVSEGNPVLARVMEAIGGRWVMVKIVLAFSFLYILAMIEQTTLTTAIMAGLVVAYAYAAWVNHNAGRK